MKVALVLLGRFPTDKAYGVTTSATIECLDSLGHEVTVYSFESNLFTSNRFNYRRQTYQESSYSKYLRKQYSKNNKIINRLYWKIYVRKYLQWVKKECMKEGYRLVWMRNFETLRALSTIQSSLILELHTTLNHKQISFINTCKDNLLLAPISKKIMDNIAEIKLPHAFAPMGIHDIFLSSDLEIDNYLARFKKRKFLEFVYVGKLFPGGVSKGVETLIAIAMFAKLNSHDIKIKVIGGDESEINRFREMIAKENVSSFFDLRGQLSHKTALNELKKSEIVILTKSTDENYAGFPLKAIEALASGRITIVEESDVYKNIFNNGAFVIWFNRELIDKIFLQIESTMRDGKLDLKLKRNVEIAKKFTWINRTLNLLAKIGNN